MGMPPSLSLWQRAQLGPFNFSNHRGAQRILELCEGEGWREPKVSSLSNLQLERLADKVEQIEPGHRRFALEGLRLANSSLSHFQNRRSSFGGRYYTVDSEYLGRRKAAQVLEEFLELPTGEMERATRLAFLAANRSILPSQRAWEPELWFKSVVDAAMRLPPHRDEYNLYLLASCFEDDRAHVLLAPVADLFARANLPQQQEGQLAVLFRSMAPAVLDAFLPQLARALEGQSPREKAVLVSHLRGMGDAPAFRHHPERFLEVLLETPLEDRPARVAELNRSRLAPEARTGVRATVAARNAENVMDGRALAQTDAAIRELKRKVGAPLLSVKQTVSAVEAEVAAQLALRPAVDEEAQQGLFKQRAGRIDLKNILVTLRPAAQRQPGIIDMGAPTVENEKYPLGTGEKIGVGDLLALAWHQVTSEPDPGKKNLHALLTALAQCIEDDGHRVCVYGFAERLMKVFVEDHVGADYAPPAQLLTMAGLEISGHMEKAPLTQAFLDDWKTKVEQRAVEMYAREPANLDTLRSQLAAFVANDLQPEVVSATAAPTDPPAPVPSAER
jgi:hypothetical protein